MDLLVLDEDLLSLELPDNFMHFMLQDDDAYKVQVMTSIVRLETVFGPIKYKFAKGNESTKIINKIKQKSAQNLRGAESSVPIDAEIDCLIMIDRSVDLVSPFCVQQNYEGQLDETFGINTTLLSVDTKILNPSWEKKPGESDTTDLILNNDDFLFKEVRGVSLGALGYVTRV